MNWQEFEKMAWENGFTRAYSVSAAQFIKWEKGAATNGFKFTDTDGNEIMVSAGNSWVCIANKSTCKPTIE